MSNNEPFIPNYGLRSVEWKFKQTVYHIECTGIQVCHCVIQNEWPLNVHLFITVSHPFVPPVVRPFSNGAEKGTKYFTQWFFFIV